MNCVAPKGSCTHPDACGRYGWCVHDVPEPRVVIPQLVPDYRPIHHPECGCHWCLGDKYQALKAEYEALKATCLRVGKDS